MTLNGATQIRLVTDAAARDIDAGSLRTAVASSGIASRSYAWTETAESVTTAHQAPEHAVVEIVFA